MLNINKVNKYKSFLFYNKEFKLIINIFIILFFFFNLKVFDISFFNVAECMGSEINYIDVDLQADNNIRARGWKDSLNLLKLKLKNFRKLVDADGNPTSFWSFCDQMQTQKKIQREEYQKYLEDRKPVCGFFSDL